MPLLKQEGASGLDGQTQVALGLAGGVGRSRRATGAPGHGGWQAADAPCLRWRCRWQAGVVQMVQVVQAFSYWSSRCIYTPHYFLFSLMLKVPGPPGP